MEEEDSWDGDEEAQGNTAPKLINAESEDIPQNFNLNNIVSQMSKSNFDDMDDIPDPSLIALENLPSVTGDINRLQSYISLKDDPSNQVIPYTKKLKGQKKPKKDEFDFAIPSAMKGNSKKGKKK